MTTSLSFGDAILVVQYGVIKFNQISVTKCRMSLLLPGKSTVILFD